MIRWLRRAICHRAYFGFPKLTHWGSSRPRPTDSVLCDGAPPNQIGQYRLTIGDQSGLRRTIGGIGEELHDGARERASDPTLSTGAASKSLEENRPPKRPATRTLGIRAPISSWRC